MISSQFISAIILEQFTVSLQYILFCIAYNNIYNNDGEVVNMSKNDYMKYITKMLKSINNLDTLKQIYSFVQKLFNED